MIFKSHKFNKSNVLYLYIALAETDKSENSRINHALEICYYFLDSWKKKKQLKILANIQRFFEYLDSILISLSLASESVTALQLVSLLLRVLLDEVASFWANNAVNNFQVNSRVQY